MASPLRRLKNRMRKNQLTCESLEPRVLLSHTFSNLDSGQADRHELEFGPSAPFASADPFATALGTEGTDTTLTQSLIDNRPAEGLSFTGNLIVDSDLTFDGTLKITVTDGDFQMVNGSSLTGVANATTDHLEVIVDTANFTQLGTVDNGISLNGATIDVSQGNAAGNVSMTVDNTALRVVQGLPADISDKMSTITIASTAIMGADVTITAKSGDVRTADVLPPLVNGLLITPLVDAVNEVLTSLTNAVPASVAVRKANSQVSLTDSTIDSSGKVKLEITAAADSSVRAVSMASPSIPNVPAFSVGYGEARTTAVANLLGTTSIAAANDVEIITTGNTRSVVTAAITKNLGSFGVPSNPDDVSVAVAVAQTDTTSTVTMEQNASIDAGGNVSIQALGTVVSTTSAKTAAYNDGKVGLTGSIDIDRADIDANIDGTITADGSSTVLSFDPVNDVTTGTDILTIPNHGLSTGNIVRYTTGGGANQEIGGLTDGDLYHVVVIDDNNIQLSLADSLDFDNRSIKSFTDTHNLNLQHSFSLLDDLPVDPATTLTGSTFNISHPFANGQIVTYGSNGSTPTTLIDGLDNGEEYAVIRLNGSSFQLADPDAPNVPLTLTAPETLTHTLGSVLVDPFAGGAITVSQVDGTGTFNVANSFTENQTVTYDTNGDPIPGLFDGTDYVIINRTPTSFQLAEADDPTVPVEFEAPEALAIVHTFVYEEAQTGFDPASASVVDANKDIFTINGHGFSTGDPVIYRIAGQAVDIDNTNTPAPGDTVSALDPTLDGLNDETVYFIVKVDDNRFRLAETEDDAIAAAAIDLTSGAVGSSHGLQPIGKAAGIGILADLTVQNKAAASSKTGGEPGYTDLATNPQQFGSQAKSILTFKIDSKISDSMGGQTNNSISVGAGIGVVVADHDVTATVGPNAQLTSRSDVEVKASISQKAGLTPEGGISKPSGSSGTGVAVAVGYGQFDNTAKTIVDAGAQIDARNEVRLISDVTYPLLGQAIVDIFSGKDSAANLEALFGTKGISGLTSFLDGTLGIKSFFFNVWAATSASGDDLETAIAGAFGIMNYTNVAETVVKTGAQVNQIDDSGDNIPDNTKLRTGRQAVDIDAAINMQMVGLAGNPSLGIFKVEKTRKLFQKKDPYQFANPVGGVKAKGGVGGSVYVEVMDNTATARVENGVMIHTGLDDNDTATTSGLDVDASEFVFSLGFGQSGGKSKTFGFSGSAVATTHNSTTKAILDSGIVVTGGPVAVDASSHMTHINLIGGVQKSESTGVGVSVGVTLVDRQTVAAIGNEVTDSSQAAGTNGTNINVDGDVSVNADNGGNIFVFSLAAAVVADEPDQTTPQSGADQSDPLEGVSDPDLFGNSSQNSQANNKSAGNTGLAIAGDVSIAEVVDRTQAYINDTGTIQTGDDDTVTVRSFNDTGLIAASGAVSISTQKKSKSSVGIAGSFSKNDLELTTSAFVVGATINSGDLIVDADNNGFMFSFTAGGAGSTSQQGINIAGSVSVNFITNKTEAYLAGARTDQKNNLSITADDTSDMISIAGAVAVGGKLGIGASVAVNRISTTTTAAIEASTAAQTGTATDATIEVASELTVSAQNNNDLDAVTAALAASKEVGASGVVAVNLINNDATATLADAAVGMILAMPAVVTIRAKDESRIRALSGAAGAGKTGVGAAFALNSIANDITASMNDASVDATGDVTVEAINDADIQTLTAGFALSQQLSVAGAVGVNLITNDTSASISNGSDVTTTGQIAVNATDTSDIQSLSGQVALSGKVAAGASISFNRIKNTITAGIDATATSTAGDVRVQADNASTISAIVAGGSGGGNVAIGGSISINQINNTVEASIGTNGVVDADGNVLVLATDVTDFFALAGNISGAGSAAIGISNASVISGDPAFGQSNIVRAYVDGRVTARGNQAGVSVPTDQVDGSSNIITEDGFIGLAVIAASFEDIETIAVGGSGAGTVGVAGSASVTVLDETTEAYLGANADINNTGASTSQNVLIRSADGTKVLGIGGGLGGGGTAGIGAGIDVQVITKTTEARVNDGNADVDVRNNFIVEALSSEDLTSVGASFGAGGSAGIAGSVGVSVILPTTRAKIGTGANIDSQGNVVVSAEDQSEIDVVAAGIAGGGSVAVGGAAAVPIFNKTTEAFIDNGAIVTADGQRDGLTVNTGTITVGTTDADTSDPNEVALSDLDNDSITDDLTDLTKQRIATIDTVPDFKGVSVTAVNTDDTELFGLGLGVSGTAAVQVSATVNVHTTNTHAYIDDGADVTADDSSGTEASVNVAAANDTYHLGIAGGGAVSGTVAVTPGAEVAVISNNTTARIGVGAQVRADNDITVSARSNEQIFSVAAAIAASGQVGVGGAAAVLAVNNTTHAYIDQNATIFAKDNVIVNAINTTESDLIAGAVGVGLGTGGVGAGVAVTVITKDTQAYIAAGATVDALALGNDPRSVLDGTFSGTGSAMTETISGVIVNANSSEDVFAVAASLGGGLFVGLSGAVTVEVIDSDTQAHIDAGAQINQNDPGADSSQSVNVSALNDLKMNVIDGSIGIGLAALSGGVDVGIVRNDTAAYINGTVSAQQDIDVNALSNKDLDSFVLSGSGGAISLAAAVTVYNVAGNLMSTYSADGQTVNVLTGEDGDTTEDFINSQSGGTNIEGVLGAYSSPSNPSANTGSVQNATGSANSSVGDEYGSNGSLNDPGSNAVGSAGAPVNNVPAGTVAFIGADAQVRAGRHVDIDARGRLDMDVVTGGAAIGAFASIGASVSVLTVGENIEAFIGDTATVQAATNTGSGDVTVDADYLQSIDGTTFGGSVGGFVALGAAVIVVNDTSSISAHMDSSLTRADDAVFTAGSNQSIDVRALNGNASLGLAAGAAVAIVDINGSTSAYVGDSGQVGNAVGDLVLDADSIQVVEARSDAISAGVISATGAGTDVDVSPNVQAYIGNDAVVNVSGNISITADSSAEGDATANGTSVGGITVGISRALSTIDEDVLSFIGINASVTAGGNVTMRANSVEQNNSGPIPNDFFVSNDVDANADTINFDIDLSDGDTVELVALSPAAGLENGRTYTVLNTSQDNVIKFGSTIAGVNRNFDTLFFNSAHLLRDGDTIVYQADSAVIPGLSNNTAYTVKVIDPKTIKLIDPNNVPGAATTFREDVLTNSVFTVPGNGFSLNQSVTYRHAGTFEFLPDFVDVNIIDDGSGGKTVEISGNSVVTVPGNNNIFIGPHDFQTGDKVIYQAGDVIDGLDSGTIYEVIVDSEVSIQLREVGETDALPIDASGVSGTQTIEAVGIDGLVDGRTYYVVDINGDDFSLATSPGGQALTNIDATDAEGQHSLGTESVDVDIATGVHTVHIDLTNAPGAGQQRLLGPGSVPLTLLFAAAGDGQSVSRVSGSSGSFFGIGNHRSDIDATPVVKAFVAGSLLDAGGNISIQSSASKDIVSIASNGQVGAIAIGNVNADTALNATSMAFIGLESGPFINATGVVINAGNDFTLFAESDHDADARASAKGAGGIDLSEADSDVAFNQITRAHVGQNATITVGRDLLVSSESTSEAVSRANADSRGFGADADADADMENANIVARSDIDTGAVIQSETAAIKARVLNVNLQTDSDAYAAAFGADSDVDTDLTVDIDAIVNIATNAAILGSQGVDLIARQESIVTNADSRAECDCGFGDTDSNATNDTELITRVIGNPSATIVAGPRSESGPLVDRSGVLDSLAFFSEVQTNSVNVRENSSSRKFFPLTDVGSSSSDDPSLSDSPLNNWNADVVILTATPIAELVVNSAGQIVRQVDITASISNDVVSIDGLDRPGDDLGQIMFDGEGTVAGSAGTFYFRQAYEKVIIDVQSDDELGFFGLDPFAVYNNNSVMRPGEDVRIDVPNVSIEFDVAPSFEPIPAEVNAFGSEPTLVQITANETIFINTLIDNPLGTTQITSNNSQVISQFTFGEAVGIIRTNILEGSAATNFSNLRPEITEPILVQLVRSENHPTTNLIVDAGENIMLNIQGLLRDDSVPISDFVVNMERLDAGGAVDLFLLEGLDQTQSIFDPNFLVDVNEPQAPLLTMVKNRFRTDSTDVNVPLGVFGGGSASMTTTYDFGLIEAGGGGTVKGDIDINGSTNDIVRVVGNTNIVPTVDFDTGNIDVFTSGDVILTENRNLSLNDTSLEDDDMRIGQIRSEQGDVSLTAANADLIDAPDDGNTTTGDFGEEAIGNNITLNAPNGGIGSKTNVIEIWESFSSFPLGTVNSLARDDIFITETSSDLRIDRIQSTTGNVRLVNLSEGSIFDANNDALANVLGVSIDLEVLIGLDIGSSSNPLEIDSSNPTTGRLFAEASFEIHITEVAGPLNVLSVRNSGDGDIGLIVQDNATAGDDLTIIDSGMDFSAAMNNLTGTIFSGGNLLLQGGDSVTIPNGGISVSASGSVTVVVDPDAGDADSTGGVATIITAISGSSLDILGGNDDDIFIIDSNGGTINDGGTIENLILSPTIDGNGGLDILQLDDTGDTTGDTIVITGGTVTALVDGGSIINYLDLETLEINAGTAADTLQITGSNPHTVNDLIFNAGSPTAAPGDRLEILGGFFGDVTYTYNNATDGTINIDGGAVGLITYTSVENGILNTGINTSSRFRLPTITGDTATIRESTTPGLVEVAGSTFQVTTIDPPSEGLIVQGRGGDDTITLESLSNINFFADTTLAGNTGEDTFNVTPTVNVPLTINGGTPHLPTLPGDTLIINPLGNAAVDNPTTPGDGFVTIDGFNNIDYNSIETLEILGVNDGPDNVLPTGPHRTFEERSLTFSAGNGNAIQVEDPDAGGAGNFMVTISVANGTLDLENSSGVSASGDGSAGDPLQITGTVDAINTVLNAGLTYTPDNNFIGGDSMLIISNDNGASGSGGAQSDTDTMPIDVFILGDFEGDDDTDANDIDLLRDVINSQTTDLFFDLDEDGNIDSADWDYMIQTVMKTAHGDANLDGIVDVKDLRIVRENFGQTGGWAQGNVTLEDTVVDAADIAVVRRYFGQPVPTPGDFSGDQTADAFDIDLLRDAINSGSNDIKFDVNGDSSIDADDFDFMIRNILNTEIGDANLDGIVDVADLRLVRENFNQTGGWAQGNVTLDSFVDFDDLLAVRRYFGFSNAGLTDSHNESDQDAAANDADDAPSSSRWTGATKYSTLRQRILNYRLSPAQSGPAQKLLDALLRR